MLTIGDKFPAFNLKAVKAGKYPDSPNDAFININEQTNKGKWQVIFFWPKDFTFVCPTEIAAFGKLNEDFSDRDTVLIGASTDSEFVHLAWKRDNEELSELEIPMIADVGGKLSSALGILNKDEAVANRATFVIDPDGIIRFVSVNDLNVGRNPDEVLRVLDALQTDELCPCNWKKGEETIDV
ncbi:MAG: peroxiredoxin (alkyl hydroperoxide reductase subunit C) [Myxococcota bacterium]|jgi:peroxiredoxin (alkyl hydroperoxide reductase subunit C)